jgi:hypothetical protein
VPDDEAQIRAVSRRSGRTGLADLREGLHVITEAAAHTVHLDGYGN